MKNTFTKTNIKTFLHKERSYKHIIFMTTTSLLLFIISLTASVHLWNFHIEKVQAKESNVFIYTNEAKKVDLEAIKLNRQTYLDKKAIKHIKTKPVRAFKTKKDITQSKEKTITYKVNRQIVHNGLPKDDERQKFINYAYKISGYNKDFILTLTAENYQWTTTRPSNIVGANGYRDYGICQVNSGYHPEILRGEGYKFPDNRYFVEWFLDPYKQIDYCWKLYKGGTKFYGYNVRYRINKYFNF